MVYAVAVSEKQRQRIGEIMSTNNATIYLKAEQNAEVQSPEVCLKDIASLTCADPHVLAKAKAIRLWKFQEGESKRQVISVLKAIAEIEKACPGASVENLGETDVVVEWIDVDRHKGFVQWSKLAFVALISFFGTGFTIMAFHNDIGINSVFSKIYEMVMGVPSDGYGVLELAYSVGLAVGIIVFFNHIGGRRITKDPTPIEVEMRIYEKDVNQSLVATADREGKTIDVS